MRNRVALLILAVLPTAAPAASFSLGAVLRAGGVGDVEMQLGSTSGTPGIAGGLFPAWLDGVDHNFQLSYNSATNIASLTGNWLGIFNSVINWNVAGGSASTAQREWTLGTIQLTAQNNTAVNTSVRLQNLSLSGPGLAVINPPSLLAAQAGSGTVTASSAAPITFSTPAGLGSWVLSGQIRFTGIGGGSGATGDQLRAAFDFTASDVPEPGPMLLTVLGFAALGALRHRRQTAALKQRAA